MGDHQKSILVWLDSLYQDHPTGVQWTTLPYRAPIGSARYDEHDQNSASTLRLLITKTTTCLGWAHWPIS